MIRNLSPLIDLDDVETIREAALRVDVTVATIRKWISRKQLVPLPVGLPVLLLSTDVDACLEDRMGNSRHGQRRAVRRRSTARFAAVP